MSDEFRANFAQSFLNLVARKAGAIPPSVRRVLERLISATVSQHSCLDLRDADAALISELTQYDAVGGPDDQRPFVLTDGRLYLNRYYQHEKAIAAMIIERNRSVPIPAPDQLRDKLNQHFGPESGNRQKVAALLAISRQLAIVTGGPGTGKTSTVVKMLDILLDEFPSLQLRLAAPTGKAAMRLEDAVRDWADVRGLSLKVETLHRLLGVRRDGRSWRHGPDNPIKGDLLIVDEASMIDLAMMHRLLAALPENTRLILLGDPDQLPSVDTGNVLADLCAGDPGFSTDFAEFAAPFVGELEQAIETATPGLTDAVCRLDRSYRFSADSDIGKLAQNILKGDVHRPDTDGSVISGKPLTQETINTLPDYWADYFSLLNQTNRSHLDLLNAFDACRILCARRSGSEGSVTLNDAIENQLVSHGRKQPGSPFYPGRPVLITRNDYNLGLFNGDIGICLPAPVGPGYVVHFPGKPAPILASRLPAHETCFAMTVHKAQGSEYDQVVLTLGDETSDEAKQLLTRELVYTAVTRAKASIHIYSSEPTWQTAIARSAARTSGMTSFFVAEDE